MTATNCPAPSTPGELPLPLTEVTTSYEPVPGSERVLRAAAEELGLYWADQDGAIYHLTRGDTAPTLLRAAPRNPVFVTQLDTSNSTSLLWLEVDSPPREPDPTGAPLTPPPPPTRLLSVPKSGGAVESLLDLPDETLTIVSAGGPEVLVSTGGGVLAWVDNGGLRPEESVPAPSRGARVIGGRVYWSTPAGATAARDLLSVPLGGGVPEYLATIEGDFLLGGVSGTFIWKQTQVLANPVRLSENFQRLDLQTRCISSLPGLGQGITSELIDARHVYWRSYDTFGSGYDPQPLVRVDLENGDFQRIVSPGLELFYGDEFLTQDEQNIYLRVTADSGLIALRKPD